MKNKNCPNCGLPVNASPQAMQTGAFFQTEPIRCNTCNYVVETTKDEWRPANMGKQLGKPKVNRTGKK